MVYHGFLSRELSYIVCLEDIITGNGCHHWYMFFLCTFTTRKWSWVPTLNVNACPPQNDCSPRSNETATPTAWRNCHTSSSRRCTLGLKELHFFFLVNCTFFSDVKYNYAVVSGKVEEKSLAWKVNNRKVNELKGFEFVKHWQNFDCYFANILVFAFVLLCIHAVFFFSSTNYKNDLIIAGGAQSSGRLVHLQSLVA